MDAKKNRCSKKETKKSHAFFSVTFLAAK